MSDVVLEVGETTQAVVTIEEEDGPEINLALVPQVESIIIGVSGPAGPVGPQGIPGPPANFYPHDQPTASDLWIIEHGLGYWPQVECYDRFGNRLRPGVENPSLDVTVLHHTYLQAGSALLQ